MFGGIDLRSPSGKDKKNDSTKNHQKLYCTQIDFIQTIKPEIFDY